MNRFTIIERDGCILVEGAMPMKWIGAISSMLPKGALLSPGLAGMVGATFAFGMLDDIDKLTAKLAPEVERQARAAPANASLSDAAVRWLASGERGNSSETMFTHLTGVDANRGSKNSHPYDPSDLRRCMLLLDEVPELRGEFYRMATVSPAWSGLVRNWTEITASMLLECGDIKNPKRGAATTNTYALIKRAIGKN